jgi:LruC domain-containing protein
LNPNTQPYLYDETTNKNVYLSKVGEDPHGIMIPYDFKYPLERVCIKNAYEKFNEWGVNRISSTNWYKYFKDNLVY